jgi:uncharacterized secreted protein with C-terminal beta-propeller domain
MSNDLGIVKIYLYEDSSDCRVVIVQSTKELERLRLVVKDFVRLDNLYCSSDRNDTDPETQKAIQVLENGGLTLYLEENRFVVPAVIDTLTAFD